MLRFAVVIFIFTKIWGMFKFLMADFTAGFAVLSKKFQICSAC